MSGLARWVSVLAALSLVSVALAACQATAHEPWPYPTSQKQANQRVFDCLTERGWDVTTTSDGGIKSPEMQTAQSDRWDADYGECSKGIVPPYSSFSDADWVEAYRLVTKTADCLDELGHHIDKMPSAQEYRSLLESSAWEPYGELINEGVIRSQDYPVLVQQCPQYAFWPQG